MLRRVAAEDRRDWDQMLPYVLFGIREVPQASTGFTPFELLFGRQPRGLLDVAKEAWEHQHPTPHRSLIEHVTEMRERIDRVAPLVREHMVKAQQAQQRHYNRAAQPREFQTGDRVMVLVPTAACKFLATWRGPYTVVEKLGPVTYRVRQPGRRSPEQLYHINLLKKWVGTREQTVALATVEPVLVDTNPDLSATQKAELQHLIGQFSDVFSTVPGRTHLLQHDIRTPTGVIVKQRPYRIPEARRQAIEDEVQQMLKLGVIEPSRSPWSSPIVLVPKPDGKPPLLQWLSPPKRGLGVWRLPDAPSGWAPGTPGKGPVYFNPGPHERLLAGTPLWQRQGEDCLLDPKWPLAVSDPSLRPTRGPSYVPEAHGYRPPAPSAVRGRVLGRRGHSLGALGRPPRPVAEGVDGTTKGWTRRQPSQVPPCVVRGQVPGLPGRTGPHQAPGEKGWSRPRRPETKHKDSGTSVPRVGGVLSLLHP